MKRAVFLFLLILVAFVLPLVLPLHNAVAKDTYATDGSVNPSLPLTENGTVENTRVEDGVVYGAKDEGGAGGWWFYVHISSGGQWCKFVLQLWDILDQIEVYMLVAPTFDFEYSLDTANETVDYFENYGSASSATLTRNWTVSWNGDIYVAIGLDGWGGPDTAAKAGLDLVLAGGVMNVTVFSGEIITGDGLSTQDGEWLNVSGAPANFTVHMWNSYTKIVRCDINATTNSTAVVSWGESVTFGPGWNEITLYKWSSHAQTENISFWTTGGERAFIAVDYIAYSPVSVRIDMDAVQTQPDIQVNVVSNDSTLAFVLVLAYTNGSVIGQKNVGCGMETLRINSSGDYKLLLYWQDPAGNTHLVSSTSFTVSLPPSWHIGTDYTPLFLAIIASIAMLSATFVLTKTKRRWRK